MNIKEAAVRYLENRPRTCKEMHDRLIEKGFETDDIEKTIEELKELNYLNDIEYVPVYINYGFSKGKGIKLIKYELFEKGVSSNDIEDGIALYEEEYGYDFYEDERERAMNQAQKVTDGAVPDEKMVGRIVRRLSAKGYDQNIIWSVVEELKKGEIE